MLEWYFYRPDALTDTKQQYATARYAGTLRNAHYVVVWLCGSIVGHISAVALCQARLVGDCSQVYCLGVGIPTQPGHPFLGRHKEYYDAYSQPWGKDGEFCITVGSVPGLLEY